MRVLRRMLLLLLAVSSCTPDLGHPASLVTSERLIAVRAEPPEAGPSDTVEYTSLVVSPTGATSAPALRWSLCKLRKPVDENTPVGQACLTEALTISAEGDQVSIRMPSAACVNFGPLAPPSTGGTLRPTDPDPTGGYYQPIRLDLDGQQAIVRERLRCDLAGASLLVSQAFRARYTPNQNPKLLALSAFAGDTPVALDAIPAGQRIRLVASWTPASAETFPVFDALAQTLTDQREALWLSWFTTAGELDDFTTGRAADDPADWADNTWQSPGHSAPGLLWLVLHDSRGGTDFAGYGLTVEGD
jgi:hypothetical protein